ncbi:type III effector [Pseudomonas sp. RGM2987]|uniref:type III effector n=1 Tax=Pseudomonas sp. RGM2987 TaxID=2930090 RepID=UPI001FD64C6C|nr:type III effector [Pseudomonas sp. RGM2987]MCJ8205554.1 type III effector [Pseudomonas sp. RGM2987]
MPDLSVGRSTSSAALAQDDRITPIRNSLSEQVRPSTTPLVPYHFEGKPTDATQQTLRTRQQRLTVLVNNLGKKSPDSDPLGYAREHMSLEGKVLGFAPEASYQDVQKQLVELGGTPHPMLSGQEETAEFVKDFNEYLGMSEKDRKEGGGFKAVWDKHCGRVGDTLGAYHSLCQEAIEGTPEGDERTNLQSSHDAFRGYAKGVMQAMTQELPDRLNTFMESRIEHARGAMNNESLSQPERDQAASELNQLIKVQVEFEELADKEDDKPSELTTATKKNEVLDTALKNVGRQDYVADLKTHSGFRTGLAVFADAGIPQGFASSAHFGASTAAIDDKLDGTHLAAHAAGTSAVLGAAHKVVSDSARPIIQTIVDKTIGSGLEKVDPLAVYPKALQEVTVNGRRVANPDRAALDKTQEDKRTDFLLKQNANNFGTISGDFTGYIAFGAAHAVREVLNQFTIVNASGIGARSLASAVGGTLMAGGQAVFKYSQTHGDEKIPTYRVKNETREWKELLPKALAESSKVLPTNMTNISDYVNRIFGVGAGIVMRTAVGDAAAPGEDAETREKMQQIITTFFSSGLTLLPFFANSVAAPLENKALNDGKDDLTARANVPWQNLTNTNRDSLPHTQPPGWRRAGENVYHGTRGASQLLPQATVAGLNLGTEWVKSLGTRPEGTAAGDTMELAERGEARPQGGPSNEPTPTTRPS